MRHILRKYQIGIILSVIIVIGIGMRFWGIESNPPSLNWDEAAWGYNSYTLGHDLKDEFGVLLPYNYIESYGDFKPPLYAYLGIIPVMIFGLTEFAVRFPSAFFGVLTVLLTYFLVRELFPDKDKKSERITWIALLSAFILAISPWHIMLSRAAFEANVATFLLVLGIFSFLRAVRIQPWLLVLSAVAFALTFYTFNTTRIVAPLLVLILSVGFRRELLTLKKQSIVAVVVGAVIVLPLIPFLLSPQANLRFREVNIFSDSSVVEEANQKIQNDENVWWSKVINNRRVGYTQSFASHYLDHFDPQFLFISGDVNPRFSIQDVGQMYLWDLPFLLIGVLSLFKKREGSWWFIPLWIAVGIIPAATARETPHALRIETILPTLQILTAYGFVTALSFMKKGKPLLITLAAGLLLLHVLYFIHMYSVHYPKDFSGEWQYGYKQAAALVREYQDDYDTVYITTALGRPYIYFLLFNKTAPENFRNTAIIKRDNFGFVSVDGYQNLRFARELPHTNTRHNLYINTPSQVPENAVIVKTIKQLNGDPVLVAYTLGGAE